MTASEDRPNPEDLPVGLSLDHYRIVATLGRGGMGTVYRAVDEKLHREVALKVLPAAFADDADRRERFLREARAAASVNHPNIAVVHDVDEAQGHAYIAMELLEGETLRAAARGPAPLPVRVGWLVDVAAALHAAHRSGIVHRDVKPDNVMVSAEGRVKVLDFGIARRLPARGGPETPPTLTAQGTIVGTPRYMSPEQLRDEGVDARADQFSWAVMAYEVLAGELPWGETEAAVSLIGRILGATPAPLEERVPGLPHLVAAVIARAMSKDPAARFASMADVVTALSAWRAAPSAAPSGGALPLESDVTLVQPSLPPGQLAPTPTPAPALALTPAAGWRRRGPLAAALGLAALVGAGALLLRHPPPAPAPAAATATPAATATATAITDLPVPTSAVPEARAEYVAGVQAVRDDNFGVAARHFDRAAALDPAMAAAHLRAAMAGPSTGGAQRERATFGRAVTLRSHLSDRDQAMLEALEPVLGRAREDRGEALRRLRAASERYPLDVEFLDWLGMLGATQPDVGLPPARRATELDPRDAFAWEDLGRAQATAGLPGDARRSFERCAAVAPDSSDCFGWLAYLDAADGRCADYERDVRRQADSNADALEGVARAMVANGRPSSAVRETLAQFIAYIPAEDRPMIEAREEAELAITEGRLDAARDALDREARAIALHRTASGELAANAQLAVARVGLLLEVGDAEAARRVAQEFTTRREAWASREAMTLASSRAVWLARIAAGPAGAVDRRAEVEQRLAQGEPPSIAWTNGWAATSLTPDEARAAVEALASDARLRPPLPGQEVFSGTGILSAEAGRALLLAGKVPEALPYLRRAAASCHFMASPFQLQRARLDLARALELTGDTAGACEALSTVLATWGKARPRSVTADAAREAQKRLRCAP